MDDIAHTTGKRPWQGTVLGILQILNFVGLIALFVLMIIFGYEGIKGGEMGVIVGVGGIAGAIFFLPLLILFFFVVRGVFRGQRWTIVVAIILTALAFPSLFFYLKEGAGSFIVVLAFWGFILWMEIACLNHPYYPKKITTPVPAGDPVNTEKV